MLFVLVFWPGALEQGPRPVRQPALRLRVPCPVTDEDRATSPVASFGALWPGPPRADDVAWVETVLTPDGFAQFRRQPNHDRRHAIGVARDVQARLADTPDADDPRWLVGRAAARHRQARQPPRRVRARRRDGVGRGRRPRPRAERGRSRRASPAASASTSATPSSAPTASAWPASPRRRRAGPPPTTTPSTWPDLPIPPDVGRRPRRSRQRLIRVAERGAPSLGITNRPMHALEREDQRATSSRPARRRRGTRSGSRSRTPRRAPSDAAMLPRNTSSRIRSRRRPLVLRVPAGAPASRKLADARA